MLRNPGFENYSQCPSWYQQMIRVDDWHTMISSPDYLNTCGFTSAYLLPNYPRTGDGMVGLWFASLAVGTDKESINSDLITPIVAGQSYRFKMDLRYDTFDNAGLCNTDSTFEIGARFYRNNKPPNIPPSTFSCYPFKPHISFIPNSDSALIYQTYEDYFVAPEYYESIMLGLFCRDQIAPACNRFVLYFNVDNVLLEIDTSCSPPPVALSDDTTHCFNQDSLKLSVNFPDSTVFWMDTIPGNTYYVDTPGTYWVTVYDKRCFGRDTMIVYGDIEFQLPSDTVICTGDSLVLRPDRNIPGDYLWDDGSTAKTRVVKQSGMYFLHISKDSCSFADTMFVFSTNRPVSDLGKDTSICPLDSIYLFAGANWDTYLWDDGSSGNSRFVKGPGTYWVKTSHYCGTEYDTITIDGLIPEPLSDTIICEGDSLWLHANGGWDSYMWDNGNADSIRMAAGAGIYWVAMTNFCGTFYDTIQIAHYPSEKPVVTKEIQWHCDGVNILLSPEDPGVYDEFTWYLPDSSILSGDQVEFFWDQRQGDLSFQLETRAGPCLQLYSDSVDFNFVFEDLVIVPNVFTPNNDGFNDCYSISNTQHFFECFSIVIYNRFGNELVSTNDPDFCWDGTYNGSKVADGVYYYLLEVDQRELHGFFHLFGE